MKTADIIKAYEISKETYAEWGVDTEAALRKLAKIPLSVHCWQGDDGAGFENAGGNMADGGIMATGNYPGRARNGDELRSDLDLVFTLAPGKFRLNLHSIYAETNGRKIERNKLEPKHFSRWIDWAKRQRIGMDFNPSYYAHPKASTGLTLSSPDKGIRGFWVEHGIACRKIGEAMGKALGSPCVTNVWIPDGYKDTPVDRLTPRQTLKQSLDTIFKNKISPKYNLDAVECKLFGIGSESYVVGSHEFYMGYAMQNNKLLCLDTGHFHPTETIGDKLSSVLMYVDEVLLHVSRGVRWDSDHVVVLSDDLKSIAEELVRNDLVDRAHIGLDYFDASINRTAAWTIGLRAMEAALLAALLEPTKRLRKVEQDGDFTSRLALLETVKLLPMTAVWDYYCHTQDVPVGSAWLDEVKRYEKDVLAGRACRS